MSIQFRCSGCGQPIEVDDEHAGKMAACPYCHRVVAVPQTSTFDGGPVPAARPASSFEQEVPPAPAPSWEPAAVADQQEPVAHRREQVARRLGNFAWICVLIAVGLAGAAAFISVSVMLSKLGPGQISPEALRQAQTQTIQELSKRSVFLALGFAYDVASVVALALSIASVMRSSRHNARGIAALVVSALFVLCVCGGYFLNPGGFAA